MDIAEIRKKFKKAAPQEAEKRDAGREKESSGREDTEKEPGGPPVAKADEEGAGEQGGVPPATEETPAVTVELLTFTLAKEDYAFKIEEVQEIIRPQRVTRIPKTDSSLLGITSLRGKITPIMDLKKILSLDGDPGGDERKRKILILKGSKGAFGVLIDKMVGVIRLPSSGIVETPAHLPDAKMKFIEGVAVVEGRFISILRMEEMVVL